MLIAAAIVVGLIVLGLVAVWVIDTIDERKNPYNVMKSKILGILVEEGKILGDIHRELKTEMRFIGLLGTVLKILNRMEHVEGLLEHEDVTEEVGGRSVRLRKFMLNDAGREAYSTTFRQTRPSPV